MTVTDVAPGPHLDAVRPWPGLDAFSEALQGYFFGRGAETEELFRRIRGDTVTLFFGQSGLGKTSLLRAGLAPRLRSAAFLPVFVRLDYAEGAPSPSAQVKAEFERETAASQAEMTPINADEGLWAYFHRLDRVLIGRAGEPLAPVLIFDQFEEMFTVGLTREASRAASQSFLGELAELIENRPPDSLERAIENDPAVIENYHFDRQDYRIVIALREDFLAELDSMRVRAPLIGRNRFRLRRMTGRQGFDAVTKPAPELIAPELAQEVLRFVGRANAEDVFGSATSDTGDELEVEPALLSLVCRELNERRLAFGLAQITPDLLAGNRESIIQSFYETALADQNPAVRGFVEDELLSESGFRESVSLERARHVLAVADVPADALNMLVSRRLLRIEERLDVARVEIIHDVLTPVIRASRDSRRAHLAQADAAKREAASRRRIMAYVLLGVIVIAAVVSTFSAVYAFHQRTVAQRNLALATEAANSLVFDLAQKYRNQGIPAAVLEDILGRARQLQDQLANAGDNSPELRNGQAIALVETASTFETLGDISRALTAARQAHDILQSLTATQPGNTRYTSNLAISNEKIGTILVSQGDLAGALAAYREQKTLVTALAQKEPENAKWQRDLSSSDLNIGDVLEAQGDFATALATYAEARSVIERLAARDHSNDQWQDDLAESDESIGSILQQQGDLSGALSSYSASLAIRKALADKDPGNTQWQRYLSAAELYVADVLERQGRLDDALVALRDSQAITKALVQKDPGNTTWQRDLTTRDYYLGSLLEAQQKPDEALVAYLESASGLKDLTEKDPQNAGWQFDLVGAQARIGNVLASQGNHTDALAAYHDSLAICTALVKRDPNNAKWLLMQASLQQAIGAVLETQGNQAAALAADRDALATLATAGATDPDSTRRRVNLEESVSLLLEHQGNLTDALAAADAAAAAARQLHSTRPDDAEFKTIYANVLGVEAWLLILNKRPQEALERAQEAHDLDPSLLFVDGNQADALLLLGRYDEAKTIYLANKEKKFHDGSSFADAVRSDFTELRKQGIDLPDMKRIEDLLAG